MKSRLLIALALLCLCLGANAQVLIFNEDMLNTRMSEITAMVVDSLTNEPVSFASVYVIPAKDTTITNFTISDAKGVATLEEVPRGRYSFHVEMMGYKPYVKERYFREEYVDLGTIKMAVDEHYLSAAVVTDVGNPIVIKKDTVEFNASSFRVGSNAMLKDLLKRMPGMEITDDGKVKFNGEEIDKLTVGGRTFFFNDQSTALNNLPASVVDKVRVIDRESEETRASGIQDGNREKVLDVGLKKEYEQGWFGNIGAKGGTTMAGESSDDELRADKGFLHNENALVSAYTEKDQVTFVANAQNIDDSGVVFVLVGSSGDQTTYGGEGLTTAGQVGINANTSRIKDVETTVSANYKYSRVESGNKADRTTFQDDGDLKASTLDSGLNTGRQFTTNLELQKENGDVWFHLRPSFNYGRSDTSTQGTSQTVRNGSTINDSERSTHSLNDSMNTGMSGDISFRNIKGKKGRILRLSGYANLEDGAGTSDETSILAMNVGEEARALHYDNDYSARSGELSIRYAEPFGERWALTAEAEYSGNFSTRNRDAFDVAGFNDYYSSKSDTRNIERGGSFTAQYQYKDNCYVTFGGEAYSILNEVYSKSNGVDYITGKDEWNWRFVPRFEVIHVKGYDRINLDVYGYTSTPNSTQMRPILNITDPTRLSMGNVYLKPSTRMSSTLIWQKPNPETFATLIAYFVGSYNFNGTTNALWYDRNGVMYSIPVNSKSPSVNGTFMVNYTTPLSKDKNWSLAANLSTGYVSSTGYQARTSLAGLDKDKFDYQAFMTQFWGNEDGDIFYSGLSGFAESHTTSLSPGFGANIKYNQDNYSLQASFNISGYIARYSLDPSANMNTMTSSIGATGSYTTKHEFEFESDISYVTYKGYADGYGQPELQWNAEISKNIGAFNLSLKVNDLLNQERSLTHTVTANYMEDSYRLIMGRYVLFGVKWNFGKMNAAHSSRARNAALNMAF